jgi:hypothetical protein
MKIHHALFVTREQGQPLFVERCGLAFDADFQDERFASLDITEDDPRWPSVVEAIAECRHANGYVGDRVWTEFSKEELDSAAYLEMTARWHHQYPQPDDHFAYLRFTYDLKSACSTCHAGAIQTAPFRLTKPPVWGRRSIFQLNWVFDEYFVKPDVFKAVFSRFGISSLPVLLHKKNVECETAVQLTSAGVSDLSQHNASFTACSDCGHPVYLDQDCGFAPTPVKPVGHYFQSAERFHHKSRRVFVSNALYRAITEAGLQGVTFHPCG